LPDFTLGNLQGQSTPLSTWAGRPLVLNFWATWCAPCRREIPLLKTLATEWASQDDVAVVGIAVDHREQVAKFADQFKIDYPLLVGEQDALDLAAKLGFDSPAFPFTVFIDRRGEVVALFVGELHRPQADLIMSTVKNLDRGSVQLVQARRQIAAGLDALAEKT
jgi:thiol-disulfide isomerase/thioredoxin